MSHYVAPEVQALLRPKRKRVARIQLAPPPVATRVWTSPIPAAYP